MRIRHIHLTSQAVRHRHHAAMGLLLAVLVVALVLAAYARFTRPMMDRAQLSEVLVVLGHARRDLVLERVTRPSSVDGTGPLAWPSSPITMSSANRYDVHVQREGDHLQARLGRQAVQYSLSLDIEQAPDEEAWALTWRCHNRSDPTAPALMLTLCPPTERTNLP